MRRILVDHARTRSRLKRGGEDHPVRLEPGDDVPFLTDIEVEEVLAIDVALERLAQVDERARRVIECRISAGLTLVETAQALGISTKSVQRTWTAARAWLRKRLAGVDAMCAGAGANDRRGTCCARALAANLPRLGSGTKGTSSRPWSACSRIPRVVLAIRTQSGSIILRCVSFRLRRPASISPAAPSTSGRSTSSTTARRR